MGAHNLGTQIKGFYKSVSVTKGNLVVNSASSIEPIRGRWPKMAYGRWPKF